MDLTWGDNLAKFFGSNAVKVFEAANKMALVGKTAH